jgi:LysM repeat protein
MMKPILPILLTATLLGAGCSVFKSSSTSTSKGAADARPADFKSTGNVQLDYIQIYREAAVVEMERGGVPASIILAQGLLESAAGQSELAKTANNHFGIKCGGTWDGKTYYKRDDDKDKDGNSIESCFRRYESVSESFLDHGEFLRDPRKHNRYGFLFNLDRTDYKAWANGLQSAGYATSPTYAKQLIDIIERYRLYEYDRPGKVVQPGAPPTTQAPVVTNPQSGRTEPAPLTSRIGRVNDVKVVVSKEGETLEDIARAYRLNPDKVVNYNDYGYPPGVRLRPGTRIYIQPKKDKWHGRASDHFIREGQTMFDVSQQYGIQLDDLRQRNGLQSGQEPVTGARIKIKGSLKKGETIELRDTSRDPIKPGDPGNPPIEAPSKPEKMTPGEDLGIVIGGDDPKPASPTQPNTSWPGKPATSGEKYPPIEPPLNPGQTSGNPPANQPVTTPQTAPPGYHLVAQGENLYRISLKYNTSVARIKQLNNLKDDSIRVGQLLKIQ